jgi:hypothetical protein
MTPGEMREFLSSVAFTCGIDIFALGTAYTPSGADLGSERFSSLEKPNILLLTGDGVRSQEAGEIWHLLDARFEIPVVLIEQDQLNSMDLTGYTHLILPAGSYSGISSGGTEEILRWLERGGTIIAINSANRWLAGRKLADISFRETEEDSSGILPYRDLSQNRGAQQIPGTIFEANLDITHPIGYGMHRSSIPVFRTGSLIASPVNRPYAQPLTYTADPLLSGYVPDATYEILRFSPGIVISSRGNGKVISFIDNPNFRAFWYGTNRLFMNAVFFGPVISVSSTR